ncbi:MAG: glycoside hydrolase family 10 protein [Fermentimonas sp.]
MHYIILIFFFFSCTMNLYATEPAAEVVYATYAMESPLVEVVHVAHVEEFPVEVVHTTHVADSLATESLAVDSLVISPPATEVRAVWLTTNYGLDWPRNRTSVEVQKRELREILDSLQVLRFNTVFFQVRARGEVLYLSRLEPVSSLIAADQESKPPFDPLRFAVEECHKRGMELHAWMVIYPLGNEKHVKSLGEKSIIRKNPSLVKRFKQEWFLDPGNPRTDDYLITLILEVVNNYDVDGIHFDYIRYPDNRGRFPDDGMYRLHGKGKTREDWRRDNITRFVTKAYDEVKKRKPWVQVSSALLGRYRALEGIGHGWTAYETVYQDVARWMRDGKHDAIYPMMYYKDQFFYPYVDDWVEQANQRIVVPGLGAYQMIELEWPLQDILDQVEHTRGQGVQGQAFFRAEHVLSNTKGLLTVLQQYYRYPAKLPPMEWLSDTVPNSPKDLRAERTPEGEFELTWEEEEGRITYNVYRCETGSLDRNDASKLLVTGVRGNKIKLLVSNDDRAFYYYVTVSDAYHNESEPCVPAFFYHSDTVK